MDLSYLPWYYNFVKKQVCKKFKKPNKLTNKNGKIDVFSCNKKRPAIGQKIQIDDNLKKLSSVRKLYLPSNFVKKQVCKKVKYKLI